jgi:hypothetical protein
MDLRAELTGVVRAVKLEQLKYETPSIFRLEDRGRPKKYCSRDHVIDGLLFLAQPLH